MKEAQRPSRSIHSEVKDITGGQATRGSRPKSRTGGSPWPRPHTARWASDSKSLMLAQSGTEAAGDAMAGTSGWVAWGVRPQSPLCSPRVTPSRTLAWPFRRQVFGAQGGERSRLAWPQWLPGHHLKTHLSASGAFKVNK